MRPVPKLNYWSFLSPSQKQDIWSNSDDEKKQTNNQGDATHRLSGTQTTGKVPDSPRNRLARTHHIFPDSNNSSQHISRRPVAYLETRSESLTRQPLGRNPPWPRDEREQEKGESRIPQVESRKVEPSLSTGPWRLEHSKATPLPRQRQPPPPSSPVKPQNPLAAASPGTDRRP